MSENTRLTDLTRMLLESPAFSTFLDQMSGTDKQSSTQPLLEAPAPKKEVSRSNAPKDVNPHLPSPPVQGGQNDAQVGMALMPESSTNFHTGNTTWADNMDFGLYDAQVYAVTSMPEGPAVDGFDASFLSGKSTSFLGQVASGMCKQVAPAIEYPSLSHHESRRETRPGKDLDETSCEVDESDPAFSLYNDEVTEPSTSSTTESGNMFFCSILTEKPFVRLELTLVDEVSEHGIVDAAAIDKFVRFCAMMEAASQRVAAATSHM